MKSVLRVLIVLPLLFDQALAQDRVQVQYYEAMASGSAEGLPALVRKLDAAASAFPTAAFTPRLHEIIQMIALLHPGSVPDQAARFQAVKAQAAANPALARVLRRLEILQEYYAAAAKGRPESAAAGLSEGVFEGSVLGMQALADAALRTRDYAKAGAMAEQIIEADPYSPLLANAYVILGFCDMYRGNSPAAARHFQRAMAVSPLPTIYGNTREYLSAIYRFARPSPAAIGEVFDEVTAAKIAGIQGLKDPRALLFHQDQFFLVDREQIITLAPDGKVVEAKPARKIEDLAISVGGKFYYLADDAIDLGTGTLTPLSATIAGKPKMLKKLRSLAVDERGDIFLLDQDAGLFTGTPNATGTLTLTAVAPVRGRLVKVDRRGNLYILTQDQRSITVLSRDGKQLASLAPASSTGKEPSIEYFALDALNHIYILDSTSIQIYAINEGSAGLEGVKAGVILLDPRPQYKNLRVLAVSATGEMAVTGKNEDNWVLFR